jgi:hypothetical protein
VPAERWATVGLLIAALVTIQQHSDAAPAPDQGRDRPPPLVPPPPGVTTAVAVPASSGAAVGWTVGAAGVVALGLSPGAAWGARLEAHVMGRRFGATVRTTYLSEQRRADPDQPTHGGAFRLASAGGGGCAADDRTRRLGWRLCAGADVNVTLARGYGLAETASPTALWGAAWAGATARVRLRPHVDAWASVEGAAAIRRPAFAIEGGARIFRPSPVGGTAALGVAVTW